MQCNPWASGRKATLIITAPSHGVTCIISATKVYFVQSFFLGHCPTELVISIYTFDVIKLILPIRTVVSFALGKAQLPGRRSGTFSRQAATG
jgi:hypothetical protein